MSIAIGMSFAASFMMLTTIGVVLFLPMLAPRYWQVRPKSDYALNLALIHEKQEISDKEFVARFVDGMDALRAAVATTTPRAP